MFLIYTITNTINGKKYVGITCQSLKDRWKRHKHDALRYKTASSIHAAIRKYGLDAFIMSVIDKHEDRDAAFYREIFWIAALQTYRKDIGYNQTYGGDGVAFTPEVVSKISAAGKGKTLSVETRLRLSKAHTGKKKSPEHIAKVAAANTGKKRTGQALENVLLANESNLLWKLSQGRFRDNKFYRTKDVKPSIGELS